jgi:tetratricopeptide (TPR) repeat protein
MKIHPRTELHAAAGRPRSTGWCAALVLLIFCLSIITTSAWAVNVRIKGKVVDGEGNPVPDVAVTVTGSRIKGKPLTSTTSKKGAFTFIVETGGFEILLEKEGFLPQIIKLDARESGIEQVKVVLESVAPTLAPTAGGSGLPEGLGTLTGEDASQLKKGLKALDKGDTAGAAAIFEALVETSPDKAEPHFYLGLTQAEAGNHEEAATSFRRATEIDPGLGQAWFNLGRSLVELKDHEGAATAFDQAVNSGAMDGATCYQLAANIYINRNDYTRIAYYLERYCQLKPGEAEMLFRLGSAYFNIGEIDKSVTALEQAVTADPEMVGAHYQLGLSYLNQGMTEQAVSSFKMVVEKAPDSPLAAEAGNWVATLQ